MKVVTILARSLLLFGGFLIRTLILLCRWFIAAANVTAILTGMLLLGNWFWYAVLAFLHREQHLQLAPGYDEIVAAAIVAAYTALALLSSYGRINRWLAAAKRSRQS